MGISFTLDAFSSHRSGSTEGMAVVSASAYSISGTNSALVVGAERKGAGAVSVGEALSAGSAGGVADGSRSGARSSAGDLAGVVDALSAAVAVGVAQALDASHGGELQEGSGGTNGGAGSTDAVI